MPDPHGDIVDAGALAGIVRYGVPWHGLIEGGILYTGLFNEDAIEVTRTWDNPVNRDCWLIQKPGQPDPYGGEGGAEQKAADALHGKEFANYALLNGTGMVHGVSIVHPGYVGAWLHIDGAGVPWSVSYKFTVTDFAYDAEQTIQFKAVRFGELKVNGDPASEFEWSITIEAGELEQSTPALASAENTLTLRRVAVDATGSRVIFGVYASLIYLNEQLYINRPLGFFQIAIQNGIDGFAAEFSLLASRSSALGSMTYSGYQSYLWVASDCVSYPGDPTDIWAAGTFYSTTEVVISKTYENRMIGYVFNSAGTAVPCFLSAEFYYQSNTEADESIQIAYPPGTDPTWEYTATSTEETSMTYTVSHGDGSLGITANNLITGAYSGSGYGNWDEIDSTRNEAYTATGMPTINNVIVSVASQDPTDVSDGCQSMPGSGTTVYPQPSDSAKAAELYSLPNALSVSIYTASCHNYSSSLKAIRLNQSSMTTYNPAWVAQFNVCGVIGADVISSSIYPYDSAYFASYNPATGQLAYPKIVSVNFT